MVGIDANMDTVSDLKVKKKNRSDSNNLKCNFDFFLNSLKQDLSQEDAELEAHISDNQQWVCSMFTMYESNKFNKF